MMDAMGFDMAVFPLSEPPLQLCGSAVSLAGPGDTPPPLPTMAVFTQGLYTCYLLF